MGKGIVIHIINLSILLMFCLLSFCCKRQQTFNNTRDNSNDISFYQDTISILISDDINVLWNVREKNVVDNSSNSTLFFERPVDLINAIKDTTPVFFNDYSIRKGDVAFLLIYSSGFIKVFKDFHMQFDVIGLNGVPEGLLEFVNNNRDSIWFVLEDKYIKNKGYYSFP